MTHRLGNRFLGIVLELLFQVFTPTLLGQTAHPEAVGRLHFAVADLTPERTLADLLAVHVVLGSGGHVHVYVLQEGVGFAICVVAVVRAFESGHRLVALDVYLVHDAVAFKERLQLGVARVLVQVTDEKSSCGVFFVAVEVVAD